MPNSKLAKLAASLSATASISDKFNVSGSLQVVQNTGINRTEVGYTEGNPFMGFTWFGRQVDMAALKANKNIYLEKPIGHDLASAR